MLSSLRHDSGIEGPASFPRFCRKTNVSKFVRLPSSGGNPPVIILPERSKYFKLDSSDMELGSGPIILLEINVIVCSCGQFQ